jgi:hypothetical protein
MVNETQQPYLYAGDDPVSGVDPNGLCFLGGSWCNGIQNAIASTFDSFRHQTASLVDLPPNLILSTGSSIYQAYDNIYQDGANGCSFFSTTTLSAITWALTEDVNAGLMAGGDEEAAAEEGVADVSAATPIGRSGTTELNVTGLNAPGQVDGVSISGHAFDQMQARGIMPSDIKDAITYGAESTGADGTTVYYSSVDNLSVVLNEDGTVVTTSWGQFKPR